MSDTEPIVPLRPRAPGAAAERMSARPAVHETTQQIAFDRRELNIILGIYGANVAGGEWRDYAIDFGRDKAVFSVFRRASEVPLYKIEKDPKLSRKQGAYSVVAQGGMILRRGHDLAQVLKVLIRKPKLYAV